MKRSSVLVFLFAGLLFLGGKGLATVPKVCVLLPTLREERWRTDRTVFLREAQRRSDMTLLVNVARNRSEDQAVQLDTLVASRCDAFVVAAHDHDDMCHHLRKYPGLRVIAYDRPLGCAPVQLYVGYDTFRVGELQGEFLARVAPGGRYLLLKGPASDRNSRGYFDGAMARLKPFIDRGAIQVIGVHEVADWSPARAQAATLSAWTRGALTAVLAPNDAVADGVIETLKGLGGAGKVVVTGQDGEREALERVRRGTQAMTVAKDVERLAAVTLQAVMELIRKQVPAGASRSLVEGYAVPTILLQPRLVTADTLKGFSLPASGAPRSAAPWPP